MKKRIGVVGIVIEDRMGEIISRLTEDNNLPSFCTACYRLGRTGKDFMGLSVPVRSRPTANPPPC